MTASQGSVTMSGRWKRSVLAVATRSRACIAIGAVMLRRVLTAVSLAAVLALPTAGAAFADAGGRGTVTITQQYRDTLLFSQPVANPCTGAPGTITATAH